MTFIVHIVLPILVSMDTKKMMLITASEIRASHFKYAEMEMRRKLLKGKGMDCHNS